MARFVKKLLRTMLSPVVIVSLICVISAYTEQWKDSGSNVTVECGVDIEYPMWEGPLGNETRVMYNEQGSTVFGSILGEKAARLTFAGNKRDLVIGDLKMNDRGSYYCGGAVDEFTLLHVIDSENPCNCTCDQFNICTKCNTGYYGTYCDKSCPKNCLDNQCHLNGTCRSCPDAVGFTCCVDGFYGPMCEHRCAENCLSCINETQCISCANGYECNGTCRENCAGKQCDITTGYCLHGCLDGYFNSFCSQECIGHCFRNKCGRNDPICEEGCQIGYWYPPYCKRSCGKNCIDLECDRYHGYCTKGCEGRHTGETCENSCNPRCVDCERWTNPYYCFNCQPGFYGAYHAFCSMICPVNCLYDNCTMIEGKCEDCKAGFWGDTCTYNCSSSCLQGICEQTSGTCTYGCNDKSYSGDNCTCPINCHNCSQDWVCDQCKTGYEVETKDCTCSSNSCTDYECTSCISKRYFKYNNLCCECSNRCKDNECFSGAECFDGCKDGFYLLDCSGTCSDIDVNCQSCFLKDIDNVACNQCNYGYYPNTDGVCLTCPINCYNGSCTYFGHCDDGCVAGYWSDNCENACHDNCLVCQEHDGTCVVCKSNTTYGQNCDIPCSNDCANNECDTVGGYCTSGCVINNYGKTCEYECEQTCFTNSNGSRCAVDDGDCLMGCISGYFGMDCTSKCSRVCKDEICHRESGKCSNGCIEGYEYNNGECAKVVFVSGEDNTMTLTIIAAGTGGVVIIVALIVCVICCFKCRSRAKSTEEGFEMKQEPHQSGNTSNRSSTYNTNPEITIEENQYVSPYDIKVDENYEQLSNSYVEARYTGLARNNRGIKQLTDKTSEYKHLGRLSDITTNASNTMSLDIRKQLGLGNNKPTGDYEN